MTTSKWIFSLGGPMIMMDECIAREWQGTGKSGCGPHYEMACGIEEEVGLLAFDGRSVLVFGDEPDQMTLVSGRGESFLVVRWRYAPDEETVRAAISDLVMGNELFETAVRVKFNTAEIVLFDAAFPGDRIQDDDSLRFTVKPSVYEVDTIDYRPTPEICLLIHRFSALSDAPISAAE